MGGITRDPKWEQLAAVLRERDILREQRIILFTESKETALYLADRFRRELAEKVIVFTAIPMHRCVRKSSAISTPASRGRPTTIRILITTEVLAEGVSLHRANVVLITTFHGIPPASFSGSGE